MVTFVEERLHLTVVSTCEDNVTLLERTVAYEHCCYITTTLVQRRFNDCTDSLAVGVCLEFEHFCFEKHLLKEFVHTDTLLCRDILALVLTAPLFHEEVHLCETFLNLIGVSGGLINLIDGKDDGHTRCNSVVDCFLRLRHDVVIGSNNDDSHVRYLSTASTHRCKRFVTGSIEECYVLTA